MFRGAALVDVRIALPLTLDQVARLKLEEGVANRRRKDYSGPANTTTATLEAEKSPSCCHPLSPTIPQKIPNSSTTIGEERVSRSSEPTSAKRRPLTLIAIRRFSTNFGPPPPATPEPREESAR